MDLHVKFLLYLVFLIKININFNLSLSPHLPDTNRLYARIGYMLALLLLTRSYGLYNNNKTYHVPEWKTENISPRYPRYF